MNFKLFFIKIIISLFVLSIFTGCGRSEYYENGYKSGYSYGQSVVREAISHLTDSSLRDYASSSDFDAETAYILRKRSIIGGVDERYVSEYKSGFIDGYEKGVEDQLNGIERKESKSNLHSSSSSRNNTGETGIKWWQWLIIIIIITPIVNWLGFGANTDYDTEKEKDHEQREEQPTETKDGQSTKAEAVLVKPWKSFLLVLFCFVFERVIDLTFDLKVYNWSPYICNLLYIVIAYSAYENAKIWKLKNGKSFVCTVTIFLSIIFILLIALGMCLSLYNRFIA